jgi:hypothetical protein
VLDLLLLEERVDLVFVLQVEFPVGASYEVFVTLFLELP